MEKTMIYLICISSWSPFREVKAYRDFFEIALEIFEYTPVRFAARFKNKQSFGSSKVCQYSNTKKTFFDMIPLKELINIDFEGTNVKGSHKSNLFLSFTLKLAQNMMYTSLVLENGNSSVDSLMRDSEKFKKMMQKISDIQYLMADQMCASKDVSAFAEGIGHANYRNDYENEVAFSISGSKRRHLKIPYLFAYNYMKKEIGRLIHVPENIYYTEEDGYVTIELPRCFGKELEQYPSFPEWQTIYNELKARGEIIVTEKLERMIEQVIEGNR